MQPPKIGDDEDRYFHELQAEQRRKLREQMESAAKELEEQRRIAGAVGTTSTELAARIRKLGFDADAALAFDLLPLVHMAWADGNISRAERTLVLDALTARGLGPESKSFLTMAALLEQRPSQVFLDESIAILRELLGDGERSADLVTLSVMMAKKSGGILGLGQRVATEERELLEKIARTFGDQAMKRLQQQLG